MSKSVAVIILARLSSSRLPGKALKVIEGRETLAHILLRLDKVVSRSSVMLATSDLPEDDPLEEFAIKEGISCYRGSLNRVGERFYAAANQMNMDYACRINGDNLFLAPEILEAMLIEARKGRYNFLSNVKGRTFPKGMSVEIVNLNYYREHLEQIKDDPYCNEHVMVCLYKDPAPADHYYLKNLDLPEAAAIQLALDTPEDWNRSLWMLQAMPDGKFDLKTTFEYYQRYEKSLSR